jgi:hypothetical protein
MKKLLVVIAASMLSAATFAQGSLIFNTRVTGATPPVDAPVVITGTTTGPGTLAGTPTAATAELFLVSLNGAAKNISISQTGFRTDAGNKYVNGPVVEVPGSNPNDTAVLMYRAFQSSFGNYDAFKAAGGANVGGEKTFTITLGGGSVAPANLTGVSGFSYTPVVVPEPSTIALGLLGAAALFIRRRK